MGRVAMNVSQEVSQYQMEKAGEKIQLEVSLVRWSQLKPKNGEHGTLEQGARRAVRQSWIAMGLFEPNINKDIMGNRLLAGREVVKAHAQRCVPGLSLWGSAARE